VSAGKYRRELGPSRHLSRKGTGLESVGGRSFQRTKKLKTGRENLQRCYNQKIFCSYCKYTSTAREKTNEQSGYLEIEKEGTL
jgi:hypothetical protein